METKTNLNQFSAENQVKSPANRQYKDTVFSMLFNNPNALREVYSAIEGVELPQDAKIDITTLANALARGKRNDVSFCIDDRLIVLIEQQSTVCDNMPLRLLQYIVETYQRIIDLSNIYDRKRIQIPEPEFIVLYNGNAPFDEHKELKLSGSYPDRKEMKKFGKGISLELTVQVYNINHGYNQNILKKCEILDHYSLFIAKIKQYYEETKDIAESLENAVKYCIDNSILKEFLMSHKTEVIKMLYEEWDFGKALDYRFEAGEEKGIEIGIEKGIVIGDEKCSEEIISLIDRGSSLAEIRLHFEQKLQKSILENSV